MDISKFVTAVERYIERLKTVKTPNATLLTGKPPKAAVVPHVTPTSVNVQNIANLPADGGAAGSTNYMTPKGARVSMDSVVVAAHANVAENQMIYGWTGSEAQASSLISDAYIVTNATELAAAKDAETSWAAIFNEWSSFSRSASHGYSNNAYPEERESFKYLPDENAISSSVDSRSMLGFICPQQYEDYVYEVRCRSISTWQNDPIGVVLGYYVDGDGNGHTLTAIRDVRVCDVRAWHIAVDYYANGNTHTSSVIAHTLEGLYTCWGQAVNAPPAIPPDGHAIWNANPWSLNPNGVKIKAVKKGNILTVQTTNYNETEYVPETLLTIDLNALEKTKGFVGPTSIGYCCISQDHVRWDTLESPTLRYPIYDTIANQRLEWNADAGTWDVTGTLDDMPMNRLLRNPHSGNLYYNGIHGLNKMGWL